MNRGITILVLTVMAGASEVLLDWLNIAHWAETQCNMSSFNPLVLPLTWFTWLIFAYTVWLNGLKLETVYLWFLVTIYFAVNIFFTGCMLTYWMN